MRLNKKCPCCEKDLTTKNVERAGRNMVGEASVLWLNCKACKSTTILKNRGSRVKAS